MVAAVSASAMRAADDRQATDAARREQRHGPPRSPAAAGKKHQLEDEQIARGADAFGDREACRQHRRM
jgi:hypothetical protein